MCSSQTMSITIIVTSIIKEIHTAHTVHTIHTIHIDHLQNAIYQKV